MDEAQYVTVELAKPMGIVFEENDADYGGIFVHSLKEGGIAAEDGTVTTGDRHHHRRGGRQSEADLLPRHGRTVVRPDRSQSGVVG